MNVLLDEKEKELLYDIFIYLYGDVEDFNYFSGQNVVKQDIVDLAARLGIK